MRNVRQTSTNLNAVPLEQNKKLLFMQMSPKEGLTREEKKL